MVKYVGDTLLDLSGAVDMGRTITGDQTPRRGGRALWRPGLPGEAAAPGAPAHPAARRRAPRQEAALAVRQWGRRW